MLCDIRSSRKEGPDRRITGFPIHIPGITTVRDSKYTNRQGRALDVLTTHEWSTNDRLLDRTTTVGWWKRGWISPRIGIFLITGSRGVFWLELELLVTCSLGVLYVRATSTYPAMRAGYAFSRININCSLPESASWVIRFPLSTRLAPSGISVVWAGYSPGSLS